MSSERPRITVGWQGITGAAIVVCLIVVGGCSSDPCYEAPATSSSPVPKNLADPATGPKIETADYSFRAPDRWKQRRAPKTKSSATQAEIAVIDTTDVKDDFTDNMTVSRQPQLAQFSDVDALAEAASSGLDDNSVDATGIDIGKPIKVGGQTAATITATLKDSDEVYYDVVQYYVPRGKTGYVITFSFSIDKSSVEQNRTAASVAATWSWTNGKSSD